MSLTPQEIYEEFKNNVIDKHTAFDLLISLIEKGEEEDIRLESIKFAEKIGFFNENFFRIIENMLISDSSVKIRSLSAEILQKKYLTNAFIPLKWAIKYETDYNCLITIIKSLEKINTNNSKLVLFDEVKKIMKIKYLNKNRRIKNNKFKRILKKIFENKKLDEFHHQQLADIITNFLTIQFLSKQFPNVYYELDEYCGLVRELDLSDFLEYEVKGTPFGWKNNISSLKDISCIKNLKQLKKIDLSNNLVENIKELTQLQDLSHLILTNNNIKEEINIIYFKSFPKLQYLDLRGNDITKMLKPSDFDLSTRVKLNDSFLKIKKKDLFN